MPSRRQRLIWCMPAAIVAVALLYWIDSDPPYPDHWDTVKEFAVLTVMMTALFLGIFYAIALAWRS